ncbi:MAG: spheroidene monooxygenase [Pseudomonadota bacterium]
MQVASISFFRFAGVGNQIWAFSQMQFAAKALRNMPGVQWVKQFGTGSRQTFHPYPNFGVYAIMVTWPSVEHAKQQIETQQVYNNYRAHAVETWTVYTTPISSSGQWDGTNPFEPNSGEGLPKPIGILTRATVKARHLPSFWKHVPDIAEAIDGYDGVLFRQGMGEVPWVHQVTFSIWDDVQKMNAFAYKDGHHARALKHAHESGWFKEELFARFRILDTEGTWQGEDPLAATRSMAQHDYAAAS